LLNQLKEKKMKTIIYNFQKAIFSAVLVLIITSVGSAAAQARETPALLAHNNSATLVVNMEAVNSNAALPAEPSAEANVKDLSQRIENWMSDGSYWGAENSSEMAEQELEGNIESWMANGSYWSVANHNHKAGARLTHKIKSWMNNGSYWVVDENK
jgi:hypothetical protein